MDFSSEVINCETTDKLYDSVEKFVEKNSQNFRLNIDWSDENCEKLYEKLFIEIRSGQKSGNVAAYIQAIKILSRDTNQLKFIAKNEHILLLIDIMIDYLQSDRFAYVSLEILKCFCNLTIQNSDTRSILLRKSIVVDFLNFLYKYRVETYVTTELPLYLLKMLFLTTGWIKECRTQLIGSANFFANSDRILESLIDNLTAHDSNRTQTLLELSEFLKVMFTLTSSSSSESSDLKIPDQFESNLLSNLKKLLLFDDGEETATVRANMKNNVIELLLNIRNEKVVNDLMIEPEIMRVALRILDVKLHEICTKNSANAASNQSSLISPILSVLLQACKSNESIRRFFRMEILPPLADFTRRPESGSTLRNRMCRLLTWPDTMIKELAAEFLFVLCKENVTRMIKYTGYGNAAGLLTRKGLMMSGGAAAAAASGTKHTGDADDSENSDTEEYLQHKNQINIVTGCFEDDANGSKRSDSFSEMSEEQKEYEAMKLVNMFDDLLKTGVIKPCTVNEQGKPEPIEHVLQLKNHK